MGSTGIYVNFGILSKCHSGESLYEYYLQEFQLLLWIDGRVRFIATVLKTVVRDERTGGSNPSLSA